MARSSPIVTQEDGTHAIARSVTPGSSSQAAQPTGAAPVRHRDASSGAMSSPTTSKTKFVDQPDADVRDSPGALPFMALDLLLEEGSRREVPRRYRHDAESFTWSLIYLYFATVKDAKGNNHTRNPHLLHEWFQGWQRSRNDKMALRWRERDVAGIPLAYPNTRDLACVLHGFWVDRYTRQLRRPSKGEDRPSELAELFNIVVPTIENPPYEELEDDRVFKEVLVEHECALCAEPLRGIQDTLVEMGLKYGEIGWNT